MADVTGPVTTLPGDLTRSPCETTCDNCSAPASHRVQGETDSFGAEFADFCDACYEKYRESARTRDRSGTCDWCKKHVDVLVTTRDYDEGMSGPVYRVCNSCYQKQQDRLAEEAEYWESKGNW